MAEPKNSPEKAKKPRKKSGGHVSIHFDPAHVSAEQIKEKWPENLLSSKTTTAPQIHTTATDEAALELLRANGGRVHQYGPNSGSQMANELLLKKEAGAVFFGPVVKGQVYEELQNILKTRKIPVIIIPV